MLEISGRGAASACSHQQWIICSLRIAGLVKIWPKFLNKTHYKTGPPKQHIPVYTALPYVGIHLHKYTTPAAQLVINIPLECRGEAQSLFISKAVPGPLFINRVPGPQGTLSRSNRASFTCAQTSIYKQGPWASRYGFKEPKYAWHAFQRPSKGC